MPQQVISFVKCSRCGRVENALCVLELGSKRETERHFQQEKGQSWI